MAAQLRPEKTETVQQARRLLFEEAKQRLRDRLRSVNWEFRGDVWSFTRNWERHNAMRDYRMRVDLIRELTE